MATRSISFLPVIVTLAAIALLCGWAFVLMYAAGLAGHDSLPASVLSFDDEGSVPTWVASTLMVVLAAMTAAAAVGAPTRRAQLVWWVATAVLVLMSLDEAASLHERSYRVVRLVGLSTDWMWEFGFAWVPLAIPIVLAAAAFAWIMRHDIPAETWTGLMIAALLFVAGAMLIEVVGGRFAQAGNTQTTTYAVMTGLEETLETLGLWQAGRAMNRHLAQHSPVVVAAIVPARQASSAEGLVSSMAR